MRKAFTMVELIMVIVIIGILAGVAMSKMAVTRDDATSTKAKSQVASVRSALTNEAQRRMMEGDYTAISNVGGTVANAATDYDTPIFDFFDTQDNGTPPTKKSRVLEYAAHSCKDSSAKGCWIRTGTYPFNSKNYAAYKYTAPGGIGGTVDFIVIDGRFDCDIDNFQTLNAFPGNKKLCKMLDR